MAMDDLDDELSSLKISKKDDEKVVAPARWLPRLELRCLDKHCLLLGGHQSATNSIMVWCTCSLEDMQHPDSSRLLALDAWVVEHCRGESLDDYDNPDEEEDEEDESSARVDELCMEQALVVRAGPNVLPKQVPLRQLLSSTLVAQGGNKGLKGATFWVYWYDQPIPTPNSSAYGGLGCSWAPGPLSRNDLGVWYRAKFTTCDTTSGVVKIKYDIDNSEDTMYLLVAFVHFGAKPPARGSQPDVLPYMDLVQNLGLPKSATSSGGGRGKARSGGGGGGGGAATAAGPSKNLAAAAKLPAEKQPKAQGRTATVAPIPAATAGKAVAVPPASAGTLSARMAVPPPPAAAAAAVAAAAAAPSGVAKPADKTKRPAFIIKQLATRPLSSLETQSKQLSSQKNGAAKSLTAATGTATASHQIDPRPSQSKKAKRQHQDQQPPGSSDCPVLTTAPPPLLSPVGLYPEVLRTSGDLRHEFDMVPLASLDPQPKRSRGKGSLGCWPSPPLSPSDWAEWEDRVRRGGRSGFVGLLCDRQEQIPIPVFNEVDQAPPPFPLEYLSLAAFETRLATDLAAAGRQQPAVAAALQELQVLADAAQPRWGQECGLSYHDAVRQRELLDEQMKGERSVSGGGGGGCGGGVVLAEARSYTSDGRLLVTRPLGIHECGPACNSPSCRNNKQLSLGIRRPLEIFRNCNHNGPGGNGGGSGGGGWSLRCSEPLEPGDFVAPLLGRVVAAQQLLDELLGSGAAEEQLPDPPGVVLLNHFFALWEAVFTRGLIWCDQQVRMWQLPPNPLAYALHKASSSSSDGTATAAAGSDPARPAVRRLTGMLALDTRNVGNVARFVRQWTPPTASAAATAGPSLVAQPVLAGGCRSPLLYYVGLFAVRRVEAGEELTCDLSAMALRGSGPGGVAGPAR